MSLFYSCIWYCTLLTQCDWLGSQWVPGIFHPTYTCYYTVIHTFQIEPDINVHLVTAVPSLQFMCSSDMSCCDIIPLLLTGGVERWGKGDKETEMKSFLFAFSLFTVLPCGVLIKQHCTGLWRRRGGELRHLKPKNKTRHGFSHKTGFKRFKFDHKRWLQKLSNSNLSHYLIPCVFVS